MHCRHILSVKYLPDQLLLSTITDKTAAVLLNPADARLGKTEQTQVLMSGTFLLLPFGGSLLLRGQHLGWSSVDQL